MATFQEDLLRQTGVNLSDGRRFRNGALISAGDAARTDKTAARNEAFDAIARGQAIQTGTRAGADGGLGDSPVARAVMAALPSMGIAAPNSMPPQPTLAPQGAAGSGGPVDVNARAGSRYADDPMPLPGAPVAAQPGYGGTRGDPGINVTGYTGSRYDENFAANNPVAPMEAADVTLARQLLRMNKGRVGDRNYDEAALARATPQQIQLEAAMLPSRQAQLAADSETAATLEGLANLKRGSSGEDPSLSDVTGALGRAPGTAPAPGGQLTAPPDIAGGLEAFFKRGGRDPKNSERIIQAAEFMAKTTPKTPATPQAVTLTYPDGTAVKGVWDGNNFSQEKQSAEATPTTLGRLISERDAAIAAGRTDLIASYDSAIAAQGKQDGLSAQDLVAAISGTRPVAPSSEPAAGLSVSAVKTKAERDALAPGTRYTGPDGKTYIKK